MMYNFLKILPPLTFLSWVRRQCSTHLDCITSTRHLFVYPAFYVLFLGARSPFNDDRRSLVGTMWELVFSPRSPCKRSGWEAQNNKYGSDNHRGSSNTLGVRSFPYLPCVAFPEIKPKTCTVLVTKSLSCVFWFAPVLSQHWAFIARILTPTYLFLSSISDLNDTNWTARPFYCILHFTTVVWQLSSGRTGVTATWHQRIPSTRRIGVFKSCFSTTLSFGTPSLAALVLTGINSNKNPNKCLTHSHRI